MAKKKKNTREVVVRICTKDRDPGQASMTPDEFWVDSKYLFLRKYEVEEALFTKISASNISIGSPRGFLGSSAIMMSLFEKS